MRVLVDSGRCVGAGQCVLAAPEVFDQREENGIVVVAQERPPARLAAAVRQGVRLCPTGAITLEQTEAADLEP